jgi:hypothetical protein
MGSNASNGDSLNGLLWSKPDYERLTITAEVFREAVVTSVNFEVKDDGWIMFPNSHIVNLLTRQEIHAHYSSIDPRISPYAQYEEIDDRPYLSTHLINFYLAKGIDIEDHSDSGPGRNGGKNDLGIDLPAISYSAPSINTTDPNDPKVQGGLKGMP